MAIISQYHSTMPSHSVFDTSLAILNFILHFTCSTLKSPSVCFFFCCMSLQLGDSKNMSIDLFSPFIKILGCLTIGKKSFPPFISLSFPRIHQLNCYSLFLSLSLFLTPSPTINALSLFHDISYYRKSTTTYCKCRLCEILLKNTHTQALFQ